jgi:hypothetical protein
MQAHPCSRRIARAEMFSRPGLTVENPNEHITNPFVLG